MAQGGDELESWRAGELELGGMAFVEIERESGRRKDGRRPLKIEDPSLSVLEEEWY